MYGHTTALDAAGHVASLSLRGGFIPPTCPDLQPVRRRNAVSLRSRAIDALAHLFQTSTPVPAGI